MASKFEVYKSGEQHRWRLKAGNGEIIATGEACRSQSAAREGIGSMRRDADDATVVEVEPELAR